MAKSTSKISWVDMTRRMYDLGYSFTRELRELLPAGYKRRQMIYRYEYDYRPGTKKLTVEELFNEFNGRVTLLWGACDKNGIPNAFFMTNRIYTSK